jgi:Holliday junction resolvasome RuvABC endonuclease subunit
VKAIGIDPSMTATGIAAHDGALSTVRTKATGDARLTEIRNAVTAVLLPSGVQVGGLVAVEDLPTHAHGAGITGMVQGVVRLALLSFGAPYVVVPPATLKKYATGKGNATKADMRMALYQRADLDVRDDNQVDAWWLRALALDLLGVPEVRVPAAQRAALTKLTVPDLDAGSVAS